MRSCVIKKPRVYADASLKRGQFYYDYENCVSLFWGYPSFNAGTAPTTPVSARSAVESIQRFSRGSACLTVRGAS
jgi:hypothetical protein